MSIGAMGFEQDTMVMQEESILRAGFPYALSTLAVASAGIYVMVTMTGTATLVAGIALTLLGSYATFGVIGTGLNSRNAAEFRANVLTGMFTGVAAGLADTARIIAQVVIQKLILGLLENRG